MVRNPQENRSQLRMVGLSDYTQVPQLKKLVVFMQGRYRVYAEGTPGGISANQSLAEGYKRLAGMIRTMQSSYGDLFDTYTTFDDMAIRQKPRKVFPFASLQQKGGEVLMAQFINIFTYILGELGQDDVIHIYGAEAITPEVWQYINNQQTFLQDVGVKMVISFGNVSKMIDNPFFNNADTVITGTMSTLDVSKYGLAIQGELPSQLVKEITEGNTKHYYLRRRTENVVFSWDLVF